MLLSNQNLPAGLDEGQGSGEHVMLFSPWYYGHHPSYLRHLILYWIQRQLSGRLDIVVMPSFVDKHGDVVALAEEQPNIRFIAITPEEQARLESTPSSLGKAFVQYQLIAHYAKRLRATHGVLMHFDSCQMPFMLGLRLPCSFSAVCFRLTFHYKYFSNYTPTWKERIQQFREQVFLDRLLAHPQFRVLFCLDPLAVPLLNRYRNRKAEAVYLPDPVELITASEVAASQLRQRLGIESDRKVFLAFGVLADGRKGTRQLLEAVSLLTSQVQHKLCILLAGEPFEAGQATLEEWLMPLRQLPVQIVTRFGYLPEAEVPLYFKLADVVVAPYQKPAGMSGLLLLAAVAQKPVLTSGHRSRRTLDSSYTLPKHA
ncbi:glycosyltransferase [Leptolyngbya sp. 7M]|uniref:glycosyltransferase n=1 Tax=Leptolyngbya sp. 7M TaxID=2812896 RepID=UPI001B8D9676|nr:glycosyltransferase [Leptolyngbya sp. 7M]QYO67290.1 glycosyltransferase [Leptolyngbya sp. 7M]